MGLDEVERGPGADGSVPYRCVGCGWRGRAEVLEDRQALQQRERRLQEEGVDRALRWAVQGGAKAAFTASLARCPRCGSRDPTARRRFWSRQLLGSAGVIAAVWAFGGVWYVKEPSPVVLWVFAGLGPVAGAGWLVRQRRVWATLDARVLFADRR